MNQEKVKFEDELKKTSEEKIFLWRVKSKITQLQKWAEKWATPAELDEKYKEFRESFIKENPELALTVELLFSLKDFVKAENELTVLKRLKGKRLTPQEHLRLKKSMRELTEWQFSSVYFLIHAGQDKKFIEAFWSECSDLYNLFSGREFDKYKKGISGQVGVYRTMEHFGLNPQLSHPDEDAFEKTDLWVSYPGAKSSPLQTKYTARAQKPILFSTPEITYPGIRQYEKERDICISHQDVEEMVHLREHCDIKAERTGKKVVGFYLACPDGSFNNLTGEPTQEFLAQIKPEIEKHFS